VLLINTSWGRNNIDLIKQYAANNADMKITDIQWFNYGDTSLLDKYKTVRRSGAQAVILVAIEAEGAMLVKDLGGLPQHERLPVISHWAIAGGDFPALTGPALSKVNLVFVQTFNLHTNKSDKANSVLATARRLFKIKDFSEVKSPAGLAHAYDLTHILARAIDKAGTTDRKKIRVALEQVTRYDGLIKFYEQPFTGSNHEALGPDNVFMARYNRKGVIEAIK
jgi:branched-chain amino acid transport system substrate-binding protein